jgi:isopenicillin N synthase-like dioxygenase
MTQTDFAAAQTLDPEAIPVIDISPALNGSDLAGVAAQIHAAATGTGFFYISGHGIDPALMDQAFQVAKDFFDLPHTSKETIAVNTNQRGWMATGMSKLQGSKTHDLKEVFFWGTEVKCSFGAPRSRPTIPNLPQAAHLSLKTNGPMLYSPASKPN